ncbi:Coproporphyrinogen III oxidase [Candidatus Terasakiella magnetica]|nr:Coproporphyrinogen III oxidase [Candidatus Terasakiella magnetica]
MIQPGFGIYIHWPFCLSKCPYCDFNSHASTQMDQDRWRRALLAEMAYFAALVPDARPGSIFFGGGTPSLMAPETVARLIEAVRGHWSCAPDLEITLEANPTSVEAGRFRAFAQAGVNRLSLGIQALDDQSLRFLGRQHSAAEALAALETARNTFARLSFDLIYARPGQSLDQWRDELARALDLAGDHLSLYQLTIEDGTAFAPAYARGAFQLPGEDLAAALFDLTQDMTKAAGLPAYEISNHARPGAECRHNLVYWQGGSWVGIGPGAHGRLGLTATAQHRSPGSWLDQVEKTGHGTEVSERLDSRSRAEELVMMGLRLTTGLDAQAFRTSADLDLAQVLDPQGLGRMIEGGFVTSTATGLAVTPSGRLVLNAVLAELLG